MFDVALKDCFNTQAHASREFPPNRTDQSWSVASVERASFHHLWLVQELTWKRYSPTNAIYITFLSLVALSFVYWVSGHTRVQSPNFRRPSRELRWSSSLTSSLFASWSQRFSTWLSCRERLIPGWKLSPP